MSSNQNQNQKDIQDLFATASIEGLDNNASLIMIDNLDSVALAGCSGVDIEEINTDDVTLVGVVLDASGSMSSHEKEVIMGFNTMLEAFRSSKQADSILLSAWTFNDSADLKFSYTPVTMLKDLTTKDYNTDGGTALYDTLLYVMTGIVAYGQVLRNNGVRTRSIIVVFSDGDDNGSRSRAQQVHTISDSLIAQETYTLAYAGFGGSNLQQIAKAVGFPSVITASATPSEIRRIFKQVSNSVIRASQNNIGGANSFFTF